MFEKKKKKDISKVQMTQHVQKLSPLAEENVLDLIEKEQSKQPRKKKIGKSYMINKLLEEL